MTKFNSTSNVFTPVIRRFVREQDSRGWPPFHKLSLEEARRRFSEVRGENFPEAPVEVEVRSFSEGVDVPFRVRLIRPAGVTGALPVVFYFHGGGWMLGGWESHERLVRELVAGSGCVFVFVEYTRAPEAEYPVPMLIFDLGTANTVCVIDRNKNYVGGMIYPGIGVSLDSLTAHASQLGGIGIEAPEHIVGKNTVECMKSGIIYSSAAAIDGIIDRLEEELGAGMTVIATGGLAKKIVPYCRRKIILDETLLLKGLAIIYRKNKR